MNSKLETQEPKRILVRGVNWLGDAVMTIPALLRLRERFPDAHIALLTSGKLAELWRHCPAINETIVSSTNESVFATSHILREKKFDMALVLPNSPRSAIECWLARIPRRIGYARPWRSVFLTECIMPRPHSAKMHKRSIAEIQRLIGSGKQSSGSLEPQSIESHQIHDFLHLMSPLGVNPDPIPPRLTVTPDEVEAAKSKFGLSAIAQPIFGMNPGAEYGPAKRWPVERFIGAAREIQNKTGCVWLIFGGRSDMELARQIEAETKNWKLQTHNLAGQTSLGELMVLLKLCRVLLTNDTGPMHLAAALGTPVVVPFGSTSPELTGPNYFPEKRHRVIKTDAPCSPCFLRECPIDFRCMNGIGVEQVVAAVCELTCSS